MDPDDGELLYRYVNERAQDAFATLVHRHFNVVYRAASRQLNGDGRLVDDVAQSVFVQLARKAPFLTRHPSLVGWLHTTTRYTAARAIRSEARRQLREMAAQPIDDTSGLDREALRSVLDQALTGLSEDDREAVLLRYFEGRSVAEIAARVRTSEGAAYKRLERAVEKLRGLLTKKGIVSSAAALAAALEAEAATPVAPGVAHAVALHAAKVGLSAVGRAGLTAHAIHFMTTSKAGLALAGLVSVLAITSAVYEARQSHRASASLAAAQDSLELAAKTHAADLAKQRELAQQATVDEQKWADLQKEVEAMKTTTAAARTTAKAEAESSPAQPSKADLLAAGQAFLAAYPEARDVLMQIGKVQITRKYAAFFRSANLTPAQMGDLVSQTQQQWLDTLTVGPGGVHPATVELPEAKLQQILGDDGFQQLKNFQRVEPLIEVASQVSYFSDSAPLTRAQTDQLMMTMANASSSYQAGGRAIPNTIDWNQVAAQATGYLTPQQISLLQYPAQLSKLSTLVTKYRRSSRPPQP